MSFTEESRSLPDIITILPHRFKVTKADVDIPGIVCSDVLALVMVKNISFVEAEDRLTGQTVNIPLDYKGKVHPLGQHYYSVEEIQNGKDKCFSVEEPFEIPLGPWAKGKVESGSVVTLTDLDHGRDLVVKVQHMEDPVIIKEDIRLHFISVLTDESLCIKNAVEQFGIPQNVIVGNLFDTTNELLLPANYRFMRLFDEEYVLGYKENLQTDSDQTHFLIPLNCNVCLSEELSSPKLAKAYKNAFFVPKNLYSNDFIIDLYFKCLKSKEIDLLESAPSTPDIPPRLGLSKSGVHRQSLMSNNSDSSSGPTRPERRKRNSSDVSGNPEPYKRLSSLEEDKHDLTEQSADATKKCFKICSNGSRHPYMDLTIIEASGHIYDEMQFDRAPETNTPSQNVSPKTNGGLFESLKKVFCGCQHNSSHESNSNFQSMSVLEVTVFLQQHQLSELAEVCNKNKLDGAFVSRLSREELISEPFNQNEDQVRVFMSLVSL